jgi:hypothetical protein
MNKMFSEDWAIIGTIDPQTVNNSEVFSDVIDMSKYDKVACLFLTGTMNGSTGTLVARAVTCDSAGNNAAALKTATQIAAASASAKQVVIEVNPEDLAEGGTNADQYVKFGAVSGSTGGPVAAVVLGKAKYGPSSDGDLASVVEIEIDKD